jgi:hypothetical protein
MDPGSDRLLDRVGAAAGIAFVLLFVAIIAVGTDGLPAPQHSIDEIARSARDHRDAILFGTYLAALLTGALLVYGAAVVARLWRAEGATGGWWIVAMTGLAATAVGLVTDTIVVGFVRAVGHGVSGDVLWIGYPSGPDGVIIAIPLAVFLLGAGLGGRASGGSPRWLAWFALVLSSLFVAGAAGVTGDEVDGGILGGLLVLGYLGLLAWIVAMSIVLWQRPRAVPAEVALTAA